ncbi:hypothetical protein OS493_004198 [Desmophyllum pertusum]|uniref:Uncharacterized protein n=1 Tax=Desmophyllum pertusum TaxID=174260 RepID=A0A9X0D6Z8_9CNID|nr:hypothetical protein OS493_004198 [Desmophyllum pertusum]
MLVFLYPFHLSVTNVAVTVQENQEKGITCPISFQTFRIFVWFFVLWYLYLYLKYCYAYYVQCKIRYGLNWSAQTQNIGYSVCLSPELPYIDSSRQFWPVNDSHVTNESTNDTLATALSHSQISYKEESILPCLRGKDWAPVHGLMNLALVQRHRREFIGPRSPLTPLRTTKLNCTIPQCNEPGTSTAPEARFIGPRSPLTPVLLTDSNLH